MRRKSHFKLSVVQKSFDLSTKVRPSLHFISLIAVRDPYRLHENRKRSEILLSFGHIFFGLVSGIA